MATLEQVIARQRRALARSVEAPMLRPIMADYDAALRRLLARAIVLAEEHAALIALGEDPFLVAIRLGRTELLAEQVRTEIERVTARAAGRVTAAQAVAFIRGIESASELVQSLAPAVRLNAAAVERMVAAFQQGSPLRELALTLPEQAQARYRTAFVQGVIEGRNPRVIARQAADSLSQARWRTLNQARTETMRAYRGAMQESYRENRGVVGGWVWVSARGSRACAICWSLHGSVHPLDEPFASHPSCRCSAGPLPAGEKSPIVPGPEQFAKLPPGQQLQVLGASKFRAYREGAIDLPDLVQRTESPRWGPGRREKSLVGALGAGAQRFYRVA